ncbi:hypothetical protein OG782_36835 [Streptomyces sp. NBC_00876]|uniref:hypothetical protein n=1 Tax=Streptomyces sp. NBC_00876 TaxID=2975853 RepID=UPI00386FD9AC|nr:hypothetical protein OG782_36835 [Streptomyces sp. NBC_00876]
MTSNLIRFDRQHRDTLGVFEVVPCIDGIPLTKLIDTFEIGAGMQPAGDAYGGLIPQYFRFGPMENHFRGQSTDAMGPKTPLLGCECGEWGCWPLLAGITATPDHVNWGSFEQPHRKRRDYSGFGPFRFDRLQYADAVRVLSAALDSDET